ncbi:MAG: hypothetical protein JWM16_990 [Verrucomicrobiales bacterium]|nr:hypothetical protein [Verrucomicrobiales bacterium]
MVRIHVGQPILTPEEYPMQFEEKQIVDYLKPMPGIFFSATEIARKAGSRRQYHDNPSWPKPFLVSLADQGFLEGNMLGHYCYKEAHLKKKRRYKIGQHLQQITAAEVAGNSPTAPEPSSNGAGDSFSAEAA